MTPRYCELVQYSDAMVCHACGMEWDTNDPSGYLCPDVDTNTARVYSARIQAHLTAITSALLATFVALATLFLEVVVAFAAVAGMVIMLAKKGIG